MEKYDIDNVSEIKSRKTAFFVGYFEITRKTEIIKRTESQID